VKFWMVVCSEYDGANLHMLQRRGPRYVHDTLEDAEREAERLAVLHPQEEFGVLEVVGLVTKPDTMSPPRWNRMPKTWAGA
jgi:hypothetical protein